MLINCALRFLDSELWNGWRTHDARHIGQARFHPFKGGPATKSPIPHAGLVDREAQSEKAR